MAVNMNQREYSLTVFLVFLALFHNAIATTTPDTTVDTTPDSSSATTEETTTPVPTTTTTTPTTTTIVPQQAPTDLNEILLNKCPCDLTGNACDVNCCCDEDCSADDVAAFTCLNFTTDLDGRLCIRQEVVLFENSDLRSEVSGDLFCIYYDNNEERNSYTNPDLVQTLASFEEYRQEFPTFSYQSDPVTTVDFASTFYKSGDPIYTVFESLAVGELGLPSELTSAQCTDSNPTSYLFDEINTCTRTIVDTDCTADTAGVDANGFSSGFRVIATPEIFQEFNTTGPGTDGYYSLYNNTKTIAVQVDSIQCLDASTGVIAACTPDYTIPPQPSPTVTAGVTTCNNVVKEVHYRVVTDGTAGIQNVYVGFVLTNVPVTTTGTSFTQTFTTAFEEPGAADTFKRSGNPGYVVGQPVLAGTYNRTDNIEQILISSNREGYMTMVKPSVSGECITGASRIPVLFDQDVRTGCKLSVTTSNLTEYCALMQQMILQTMEFESVPEVVGSGFRDNNRYVGLYGNSDVMKTGDWVKIQYENRQPPTPPAASVSTCSLNLGMHIQILYANVGALVNPQPKIIGVSFVYNTATAVQIRRDSDGAYRQEVEITASVAFTDVSKPAVGYQGEPPIFLAKIPYDFFYPFISGGAASPASGLLSSAIALVLVLVRVL